MNLHKEPEHIFWRLIMMERYWLPIDYLEVTFNGKIYPQEKDVTCYPKIDVGGRFCFQSMLRLEKADETIWWNNSTSNIRFLEVPATRKVYHYEDSDAPYLENVVFSSAIVHCRDNKDELRQYLLGGEAPGPYRFIPESWQGLRPEVPIDFVMLYGFEVPSSGKTPAFITANVEIDHHFVLWHLPVWKDGEFGLFDDNRVLKDEPLRQKVVELMQSEITQSLLEPMINRRVYGIPFESFVCDHVQGMDIVDPHVEGPCPAIRLTAPANTN